MAENPWPDAARDALALIGLYLESGPDRPADHVARNVIMLNGEPDKIADACAAMFAGTLLRMEQRKMITSAAAVLQDIRDMYAGGQPGPSDQA